MKAFVLAAVLLVLASEASATTLTFETMFPQCVSKESSSDFMESVRCGCYFLIPNLHFETAWNLVVDATFGNVEATGSYVLNTIWSNTVTGITEDAANMNLSGIFNRMLEIIKIPLQAPLIFIYGLASSAFVYILLLTFEFVKTYLIIATSWLLWSEILFHETKGADKLGNAQFMSVLIAIILIVGSIVLLVFDVSVWKAG